MLETGKAVKCSVWGEGCPGVDQGDAAAAWLEKFLGRAGVRLVRFPDGKRRPTDPKVQTCSSPL